MTMETLSGEVISHSTRGDKKSEDFLGIPEFLSKLLVTRGFTTEASQKAFLYPSLSSLKDPFLLHGMNKACDRLLEAYEQQQKVCIYADFDLDGTSGLALLSEGFKGLGFKNVVPFQPRRIRDGYGFHKESVEELNQQQVSLIVTVDVGITAIEATTRAQSLGIDVIITDHHLPQETLPPAYVVINPNTTQCLSGLGYLSGVGVAFYLLRALKRRLHEKSQQNSQFSYNKDFDLKSVLDFFTIGTLTDMVPLVEDNRVLVRQGVSQFAKTQRPGLREMLKVLSLNDKKLTSQDLAIRLAPKLNALSRMESEILPIDILLEEEPETAKTLVKYMMEQNALRQYKQLEAENEALDFFNENKPEDFIFIFSKNFHQGVVGLVATRLVQRFHLPTWIGTLNDAGIIKGSSRLPDQNGGCLVEAMSFARDHLARFGGHSKAAGFELHESSAENFRGQLSQYFKNQKTESLDSKKAPVLRSYDFSLTFKDLTLVFLKWYDFAGPYGTGFPIPLFLFKDIKIIHIKKLKGGHLKLTLEQESFQQAGMLFNGGEAQIEQVEGLLNQKINLIGEVQGNYFRGNTEVQILIKEILSV